MKRINTKLELVELANTLGVRPDWHEPDEQNVDAECIGFSFDNAGFWGQDNFSRVILEKYVVIKQNGKPVAEVNLATLFSLACQ